MPNNSQPVVLPVDAYQDGDAFQFAGTNALGLLWNGDPIDIVPPQAQDHVPSDVAPEGDLGPSHAAIQNMSETAKEHLPDHFDLLLNADQLSFAASDAFVSSNELLLEHVAERAEEHLPQEIPPDDLPEVATEHMPDVALTQVHDHVDWLIS